MTRFLSLFFVLVTILGCQEPFMGDGEDEMTVAHSSWSAAGTLYTGNSDEVVTLQANFDESGPYTLQFASETPQGAGWDTRTIAYIDWKVEGNWVHREITLGTGASISGTGEAVRVQIRDAHTGTGIPYNVSAQVAKGTRPNIQQPATYALYSWENIPPAAGGVAGTLDVPVPQGIGVVSVFTTVSNLSVAGPTLVPAGSVLGLGISALTTSMQVDPTNPIWYPLPGKILILRFKNANAFAVKLTVVFGIDG